MRYCTDKYNRQILELAGICSLVDVNRSYNIQIRGAVPTVRFVGRLISSIYILTSWPSARSLFWGHSGTELAYKHHEH